MFDDPNLASHGGLLPVMALAERAGLPELLAEHVQPGGECGLAGLADRPRAGRPRLGGRRLTSRIASLLSRPGP